METKNVGTSAVEKNAVPGAVPADSMKTESGDGTKKRIILIIAAVVLVLAGLIWLFVVLDPETTGKIRDTMVVIYVLETIVTVSALVVLVVQLAKLVNYLKYEIQPIVTMTGKTVRKFSGTVSFLCDNAVEPTVNAASTLSGIKNAVSGILSIFKK